MKIVQYPDFTTRESQVVISKRFKKIKIPVELSDRNQIDYKDGVIHIDKRLSDEKKILALHHEVEHFNFDLHAPIWVLSLKGLKDWFDPKNKDLIFKSSKKLFKQKNKLLKISSIAMPCILSNRFDNLIEDIEIDKHLKEDHKLNVELREGDWKKYLLTYTNILKKDSTFRLFDRSLTKLLSLQVNKFQANKSMKKGVIINTLSDFIFCLQNKINFLEYSSESLKILKEIEKEYIKEMRGIFKKSVNHRFELERSRLISINKAGKIISENKQIISINPLKFEELISSYLHRNSISLPNLNQTFSFYRYNVKRRRDNGLRDFRRRMKIFDRNS